MFSCQIVGVCTPSLHLVVAAVHVELCHFAATRSHISDWPRPQKAVLPHHRGPASSSQRRSGPLAMSIYRASPLAFRAYQLVAIDVAARARVL